MSTNDPEYAKVTLIIEDSKTISTTVFLKVPSVDVEELYEPDTRRNKFIFTIKPEPDEAVDLSPGEQILYINAVKEKSMAGIDKNLIPGWYEWFSDNASKTHVSYIAHVQENGGIFLPEVTTTYVQFHDAVDQGRAHRMEYADQSDISEPTKDKLRMALALTIISDKYPGYLDKKILEDGRYVALADHILNIVKTIKEVNQ